MQLREEGLDGHNTQIFFLQPLFLPAKSIAYILLLFINNTYFRYAWDNFRIGYPGTYTDTNRVPYINSKFPIQYFDQFHKINVPRWTTTDNLVTDAYVQLVDKYAIGFLSC